MNLTETHINPKDDSIKICGLACKTSHELALLTTQHHSFHTLPCTFHVSLGQHWPTQIKCESCFFKKMKKKQVKCILMLCLTHYLASTIKEVFSNHLWLAATISDSAGLRHFSFPQSSLCLPISRIFLWAPPLPGICAQSLHIPPQNGHYYSPLYLS